MMKYLLVFLVVVVAIHIWRNNRRKQRNAATAAHHAAGTSVTSPQTMVTCAHCGLHLPQSDAIVDQKTIYFCCDAHRRLHSQ